MKQVIDFLRKIGLLRVSSGDSITGEYDDRKDLKKDSEKSEVTKKKNQGKSLAVATIIFWTMLVVVVLFLLSFLISYGFSFWLFVFILIWFFFFKTFRANLLLGKLILWKMIVLFFVISFFSLVFVVLSGDEDGSKINKSEHKEETSEFFQITQASFSSFMFASDSNGDGKDDTVHLTINPTLNFNISGFDKNNEKIELKEFEIRDLEFSKKPSVGKIKRIAPKHRSTNESCTGFYFGGCDDKSDPSSVKDDGDKIKYEVVEVSSIKPEYYDQVGKSIAMPDFRIILEKIGEFDYDKVMKERKVVSGGKYYEYAGLEAEDLVSVLELNVVAKLSNGDKIKKHLIANFGGKELLRGGSAKVEFTK